MALPINPSLYSAFAVTMFFMAMTPGPAVIYCIRTGLKGERLPVLAAVAGLNLGNLVWFAASAVGLGVILSAWPWLFPIIATLGGLYLIYISVKSFINAFDTEQYVQKCKRFWTKILRPNKELSYFDADKYQNKMAHEGINIGASFDHNQPKARFFEGITVQLLNPKAILFFTAVLPPFIDITHPIPQQLTVFAATTVGMDVLCMTSYGFLAIRLSQFLQTPKNKQLFDLAVSAILGLVGLLITLHSARELVAAIGLG